jgi:hypothetical protein
MLAVAQHADLGESSHTLRDNPRKTQCQVCHEISDDFGSALPLADRAIVDCFLLFLFLGKELTPFCSGTGAI